VKTARIVLIASAVLIALSLVAAAWAAPGGDGGAAGDGSGGARALPVVPSAGGGSEPAPDNPGALGGVPDRTAEQPPVTTPLDDSGSLQTDTETDPDEEIVLGLDDQDQGLATEAPTEAEQGDTSGGGFSFLASTGFEIASLVTVGVGMLVTGVLLRGDHRAKAR
jgi:hypothetical protein